MFLLSTVKPLNQDHYVNFSIKYVSLLQSLSPTWQITVHMNGSLTNATP